MVVHVSANHTYHYPLEKVVATHLNKYPNEKEQNILEVKVMERRHEPSGVLYLRRIATCVNVIPEILRKISVLKEPAVYIEEECWVNKSARHCLVRSHNLTWADYANVWEASSFYVDKTNPQWTKFEQNGAIEILGHRRIGWFLEYFLQGFMNRAAKKSIQLMEELLYENSQQSVN